MEAEKPGQVSNRIRAEEAEADPAIGQRSLAQGLPGVPQSPRGD